MLDKVMFSVEQAKLGEELEGRSEGASSFLEKIFWVDLVSLLGADWLRTRRTDNLANLLKRTKTRLQALGVERECPTTLTLVLPIFRGAADESREELQELWARLLAATVDPGKCAEVRQDFAAAIAKLDPHDATVLIHLDELTKRSEKAGDLGLSRDQLQISLGNLHRIGILGVPALESIQTTPFGREFIRLVVR